jgi:hypothetical protein
MSVIGEPMGENNLRVSSRLYTTSSFGDKALIPIGEEQRAEVFSSFTGRFVRSTQMSLIRKTCV